MNCGGVAGSSRARVLGALGAPGLAGGLTARNMMHMKRTNLVLPEDLLEEAVRLSGAKTYSAAVVKALAEYVRRIKARQILDLRGSGLWEGDLDAMRGTAATRRHR